MTGKWSQISPYGLQSSQTGETTGSSFRFNAAMDELEQHNVIQAGDANLDKNTIISRGQFVQWLARAYNFNINTNNPPQFSDVSTTNPYASAISEALIQGWLPSGSSFHPNAQLTRESATDLLVDWLGWAGVASNPALFKLPYRDVAAIPRADQGAAAIVVEEGMLPLVKGKFDPNAPLTVGQAANALVQAIQAALAAATNT